MAWILRDIQRRQIQIAIKPWQVWFQCPTTTQVVTYAARWNRPYALSLLYSQLKVKDRESREPSDPDALIAFKRASLAVLFQLNIKETD